MNIDKQKPHKSYQKQQNTRSSSALSQELSLQQQKKRKFYIKETIYVLYYLGRIALTTVILIVLHQNFISKLLTTNQYARMQENIALWKLDVIVNITTVNSYNCPQGYQTYTSYEWPGIKEGCYCYTSLGGWDYMKILQGSCNQLAMSAGCRTVNKINPIPFLFWKKDQLICLKRVKNLDFFASLDSINITTAECAQGKDYQIGIPQSLNLTSCPLTNIDSSTLLKYQIPQIKFSFSRQTSYPVVSLKMTEYQFCPDFSKQNISPTKQRGNNYNLQNKVRSFCQGIDPRVVIIDQIGQDQLFQNNPRIKDVISVLPAYPEPMPDYKYKLGFIRYPEWNYKCRKSEDFALPKVQKKLNLQDAISYTALCIAFGTLFIVLVGVLLTVFFISRKIYELYYRVQQKVLYDTLPQIQRKKPNLYEKLHKKFLTELIIFVASILVALAFLIVLAVFYQQLQTNFQWYKESQKCTSQTIKQLIDLGYLKYFDKEQRNILLCIIFELGLVILDTIMFLWRNFKGDLRKQDHEQEMTNLFDDQFNNKNHQQQKQNMYQLELKDKQIEVESVKYGQIVKNQPTQGGNLNITQESLISMEYAQPNTIIRPKRPKRAKTSQSLINI